MDTPTGSFRWPPNPRPDPPPDAGAPAAPGEQDQHAQPAHSAPPTPNSTPATPGPLRQALLDLEAAFLAPTATTWPPPDWQPEPASAACPRCATTVGPSEADGDGCPACRNRRLPWQRAFRLGEYDADLAEAVQQVKFTTWRRLASDLGIHLARRIAPELDRLGIDPARARLVPMPTATARRLNRGIDHPLAIARGVRRATGIPISRPLRKALRPPNADLPRSARRANVAGSIRLTRTLPLRLGAAERLPYAKRGPVELVILLDDVRTTGATMTAASRVLKARPGWFKSTEHAPAALWIAALAVTPTSDRRLQGDRADSEFGPRPTAGIAPTRESGHTPRRNSPQH